MNNEVYCSTGAYIGRENGYDPYLIPKYGENIGCDGFEFMIVSSWRENPADITAKISACPLSFKTLHADKYIGMYISDHALDKAHDLFERSLTAASNVGARRMVLHLWGGEISDSHIEYNIHELGPMLERCAEAGITLCVENVPCTTGDPMEHWRRIAREYPDARFTFDTRFAAFADQIGRASEIFSDPELAPRICHMHISDFVGPVHDFRKLRPIPQPGQGIIDFESFFSAVAPLYHGSITLESPSLYEGGRVDTDELSASVKFIKEHTKR